MEFTAPALSPQWRSVRANTMAEGQMEYRKRLALVRQELESATGRSVDGLLLVDSDLRVSLLDARAATRLAIDPIQALRASALDLAEVHTQSAWGRFLVSASASSEPMSTTLIPASGDSLDLVAQSDGEEVVIALLATKPVASQRPAANTAQVQDWLDFSAALCGASTLVELGNLVAEWLPCVAPESRGALATKSGQSFVALVGWPGSQTLAIKIRFDVESVRAFRTGRACVVNLSAGNPGQASREDYILLSGESSVIPLFAHGQVQGILVWQGSATDADLVVTALTPHLSRLLERS